MIFNGKMARPHTNYEYNSLKSEDFEIDLKPEETKLELYDDLEEHVEGEIRVPGSKSNAKLGEPGFNSLDEPIKETILRDVKIIGIKFFYVLFPREKKTLLKEWDLWGPLIICTFMAMILQGSRVDKSNDGGPEFAEVFIIVWVGSMIVTLNSKLLGGHM
ncbi:protein YIPF6-like [Agrilus planipennis]|uniref:Protein YIPF6-like n=1 Tax=Agrilus planipennis TaxID=224129 RepID=A0A7F5RD62_AGRPL|nr:protein YIPF6-like [Agrilus planipennis]XP_025833906.1 protein YIPF6-like [Agrilus planipennis]